MAFDYVNQMAWQTPLTWVDSETMYQSCKDSYRDAVSLYGGPQYKDYRDTGDIVARAFMKERKIVVMRFWFKDEALHDLLRDSEFDYRARNYMQDQGWIQIENIHLATPPGASPETGL